MTDLTFVMPIIIWPLIAAAVVGIMTLRWRVTGERASPTLPPTTPEE